MADRQPRRWTSAEDQILRDQVDAQQAQGVGRDWCQVALALPERTNKDCRKRWHNSVAEGLKKGQWSMSEDQLLTHGVHRYGSQWTKVATCVNTRSADQCAKRWQQSLDPRLDRSEWREREDADLLAAVERLGRHWKDIQEQYLPHRSKNCVKNRYSVLARRNTTHLIPYEDSVEGSSSDPGTPLQLEVDPSFGFTSAPPLFNTTPTSYQHLQYQYESNNGMAPTWLGFSDPNDFLAAGYPDTYSATSIPGHPSVQSGHVLPNNVHDWGYMQATISMEQPMQYSTAPPLQFQTCGSLSPPQPSPPTSRQYSASMAHTTNSSASAAEPLRRLPHRRGPNEPRRDSAPFGWSPQ